MQTISLRGVVGLEQLFNGETLFTLKAASVFGVLPEIDKSSLPPTGSRAILEGVEKVVDAAHRYLAVSTIDICRDFTTLILAAWLQSKEIPPGADDLGKLIKKVPEDSVGIQSAAAVIARLHARGKNAEQRRQEQKGNPLAALSDADAELSVSLVGFLLRQFGWAR
jgi:hypothetical protein